MLARAVNSRSRKSEDTSLVNGAGLSAAPSQRLADGQDFPDKIDGGLLRITGVCVVARIMAVVDTTVVAVAQRTFIDKFESTQAVVAWTITGYTLALATVIPLAGWAADRFGTRRVFMGSLLLFTVGSLLCAVAPNIALLIAFRVLEGLGGGMLLPLKFTILARQAGPKRLGRMMAVVGVPTLLGPMCGPVVGGWLIESFGWQWIFLINVPIGVTAFILAGIVFPKDQPGASGTFDFVGMLLLSPGLATFLYGVSSIPRRGTMADQHVWSPVVIGLVLIIGFVVHALFGADNPLIDLRLFKNRVVALASLAMVAEAGFFGAVVLFPSFFQQLLHQTPLQSGLHLIPKGIGALLTIPIAGYFVDKRGPTKVVPIGITLAALGMGAFAYGVSHQMAYSPILLLGLALIGMGIGCTMMSLWAAAMRVLRPDQVARGSTLINVTHQVAASAGTALMSVIVTSQFNHSANITAANKLAIVQQAASRHGVPVDPSTLPRQARVPEFTSAVLHDLSHAYAVVFVVAVVLITLMYVPVACLPKKPTVRAAREPAVRMVSIITGIQRRLSLSSPSLTAGALETGCRVRARRVFSHHETTSMTAPARAAPNSQPASTSLT